MADLETAMRSRIKAYPAVAAIAGTKVEWEEQPQGVALPHVTLLVVSDLRPQHLKGFDGARDTRVQADCRATTKASATALARAVIASMAIPGAYFGHMFGRVAVEGPRPLNEYVNGTLIYRQAVDLIIWHVGD